MDWFQIFYSIGKQAYKLKLSKKCRIYDIFYIWLLKKNTTKKKQVDENGINLNAGNNIKIDKIERIWNNIVYIKESKSGYLLRYYSLVF